ncbi:hypothetical protein HD806DRAFT_388697 [Xylariaceae sp. AK1471]|nr:hypothetical protein HD806DRAFT_388697 [Xylariaceae sp. AK1471]
MSISSEDAIMDYAASLVERLSLDQDGIFELIETLDAEEQANEQQTEEALPFSELIEILSDPSNAMPAYLTANEDAVKVYTDAQMDIIVLLIESRHWYTETARLSKLFYLWGRIFSHSRQQHREARGVNLWNLHALMQQNTPNEWTGTIHRQDLTCQGLAYDRLKKEYFPCGIDDAIPGFAKHHLKLRRSVEELRKRYIRLQEQIAALEGNNKLELACYIIMASAEPLLASQMRLARKWFKDTADQLVRAQLPGSIFGFNRYGEYVYVEHIPDIKHRNKIVLFMPVGDYTLRPGNQPTLDYVKMKSLYNPIRMRPTRPGSPWCDWFRNVLRPDHGACSLAKGRGDARIDAEREAPQLVDYADQNYDGPVKIKLPHAVLGIARHFDMIFAVARRNLELVGELPQKELTEKERERHAKEVSEATGEPYWRVRDYEANVRFVSMRYAQNTALRYRPVYDGAGNLRLDYMNALLQEITHGVRPADYRRHYGLMVIKSPQAMPDEDGPDLSDWPEEDVSDSEEDLDLDSDT